MVFGAGGAAGWAACAGLVGRDAALVALSGATLTEEIDGDFGTGLAAGLTTGLAADLMAGLATGFITDLATIFFLSTSLVFDLLTGWAFLAATG